MFDQRVLAIDIGTHSIKIVVGKQANKTVMVEDALMVQTPPGSFHDGKILNMDVLKKQIHELLKSKHISCKKAICTVESTSIIMREITLPALAKDSELHNMVHFEIEQYLPIMLSEYVIEYKILESFYEDHMKKYRILVAALPKMIAENYLNLLLELKLKPVALDIHSNAISKLFDSPIKINQKNYSLDKTVAVIDMGYTLMNLNIIEKGIPQFSRLVTFGGKDIDANIANAFHLTFEEAEGKKIDDGKLGSTAETHTTASMLNEMICISVDQWIKEIERIFQYYRTRNTGNQIDEIYLYGGSSKLSNISQYIGTLLNRPTFKIEDMSNIRTTKTIELGYFLNAIGAILRR